MQQVAAALSKARVVPVIRAQSSEAALATAHRLLSSGLSVVELTATTPNWLHALAELRARYPDATVGVGTVTSAADAEAALDTGADFLVSPWPAAPVRAVAQRQGTPFLEGGFSPGEIAAAAEHGIAKLFPAHVGGPAYLVSLLAVLPGARIMPTGGIRLAEAGAWLAAGAFAVGVGSELAQVADPAARIREVLDEL